VRALINKKENKQPESGIRQKQKENFLPKTPTKKTKQKTTTER
jgi:hypothetical protein